MRTLIKEKCTEKYDCYYDSLLYGYIMVEKQEAKSPIVYGGKKKTMSPRQPIHTLINDLGGEIWKTISWGNGEYSNFEVSNLGRVRETESKKIIPTYFAKTRKANQVHLGNTTTPNVAHLVAEEFVPNPFGYPFILHKDGNYQNDRWTNLEWVART